MKEIEVKRVEMILLDMEGEVYQLGIGILEVIESDDLPETEKITMVKNSIKYLTELTKKLEEREECKNLERFKELIESIEAVKIRLAVNLEYLIEIEELRKLRDRLRAI